MNHVRRFNNNISEGETANQRPRNKILEHSVTLGGGMELGRVVTGASERPNIPIRDLTG